LNGVCQPNQAAAGSACGSSADTDCDNPDTCDEFGACQQNWAADGTPCDNPICPEDAACENGECLGSSLQCDDGLFCNGLETCDALLGCQPGENPCDEGFECDETIDVCFILESGIPTVSGWGLIVMGLVVVIAVRISNRVRNVTHYGTAQGSRAPF
jgi:hypothetical protein